MESGQSPACFHPLVLPPFLATRVGLETRSVLLLRRVMFLSANLPLTHTIPAKMPKLS